MRAIGKITKTGIGLILLAALCYGGMTGMYFVGRQAEPSGYEVTTVGRKEVEETTVERVNINTADQQELETLPGVGEVIAQRIIAYREENGTFSAPEELLKIQGIGEKTLETLREFITWEVTE